MLRAMFRKLNPNNVTFKTKIITHFTMITIILISIFFVTYQYLEKELRKTYYNNLISIREIKKNQLIDFFKNKKYEILKFTELPFVIDSSKELSKNTSKETYDKYDETYTKYFGEDSFNNLYLISTKDDKIIYSLKNKEYENKYVINTIFNHSNFQQVYYSMIVDPDNIKLTDFEFIDTFEDKPTAYFATPIYDNGKMISIIILELPIEKIEKIMTGNKNWEEEGLGNSGETYIVANDCTMRNDSRFYIEDEHKFINQLKNNNISSSTINLIKKYKTNVLTQQINKKFCEKLFKNKKSGIEIVKDYRGEKVLSAYAPLQIDGVDWFIISKIDKSEIFVLLDFLEKTILSTLFLLFLFLLTSTYLFSYAITNPINRIKKAFEDLGKGDFTKRIIVKRNNEFSSLAKSYNHALNKLEKLTQSVEYLSIISSTDYLTKIYNRQKFNEELSNNIKRSHRTKESFCVAILDIDFFKQVNDTYGHDCGDKVLKRFANIVKNSLRETDIFARWGGEEFIILFIDTTLDDAKNVCEKIRLNIQTGDFEKVENLTCSIGVTENHNEDNKETIVDRADKALYCAKEHGRNRVIQVQ